MKTKEQVKPILPGKMIDILEIVKDEYLKLDKTKDVGKKVDCLSEVLFGFILYHIIRYDNGNYRKLFDKNETQEDTDNGHKGN